MKEHLQFYGEREACRDYLLKHGITTAIYWQPRIDFIGKHRQRPGRPPGRPRLPQD